MEVEPTAAYSKPVGYVTLGNADNDPMTPDVPANTDVTVSIPLERPSELAGKITGIAGNTIEFADAGLLENSLADPNTPYQLTITSGQMEEGLIALVAANTSSSVTVSSVIVGNLSQVQIDDAFSVSKAWTLGTFFPANLPPGTTVFAFSGMVSGTNLAPDERYSYSGTDWFQTLGSGGNGSKTLLFPGESLFVRSSVAINDLVVTGSVPTAVSRTVVRKLSAMIPQDTRISITTPTDQPIENLTGVQPGDFLYAFDNKSVGQNKSPNEILAYSGTEWFGTTGVTGPQNGIYKLKAGQGYILRRPANAPVGDITISLIPDYVDDL